MTKLESFWFKKLWTLKLFANTGMLRKQVFHGKVKMAQSTVAESETTKRQTLGVYFGGGLRWGFGLDSLNKSRGMESNHHFLYSLMNCSSNHCQTPTGPILTTWVSSAFFN